MLERDYAVLMAEYNAWMNDKLYAICADLSDAERRLDRGAFFKSIHGTLAHLLWADRAWLIRLKLCEGAIGKPDAVLFDAFEDMRSERKRYDQWLLDWARSLEPGALSRSFQLTSVVYKRTRRLPLYLVIVHMFNHQTHHRGQLTTLLSQLHIDPGVTDLPWIPYADFLAEDVL